MRCGVAAHLRLGEPAEIPHESAFSRAFAEFAKSELPQRLHAALIQETQKDRLMGHISRDSTQIDAREKPQRAPGAAAVKRSRKKKGRPKKGEPIPAPEPSRPERQADMTLEAIGKKGTLPSLLTRILFVLRSWSITRLSRGERIGKQR